MRIKMMKWRRRADIDAESGPEHRRKKTDHHDFLIKKL
jgi:hypothetical protein